MLKEPLESHGGWPEELQADPQELEFLIRTSQDKTSMTSICPLEISPAKAYPRSAGAKGSFTGEASP